MCARAWYVYIIRTRLDTLYTGITTDVARRFQEHRATYEGKNSARGAKYFRQTEPLTGVYIERCPDRSHAAKREVSIKRLSRGQKLGLLASRPIRGASHGDAS